METGARGCLTLDFGGFGGRPYPHKEEGKRQKTAVSHQTNEAKRRQRQQRTAVKNSQFTTHHSQLVRPFSHNYRVKMRLFSCEGFYEGIGQGLDVGLVYNLVVVTGE